MAGIRGRSGGKNRKPDALRLAEGTFRADRHGDPEAKPQPKGIPSMPKMSLPEARAFWREYVPKLIELNVAKDTDTPRLQMLCESWALLRRATKELNKDPICKESRVAYAEYAKQFANAAAEFGMNPADRSRIIVDKPKKSLIQGRKRG